jgi:hypothetical protein
MAGFVKSNIAGKGLSSIRDPAVVFAQTREFLTDRKTGRLTSSFCLVFALY